MTQVYNLLILVILIFIAAAFPLWAIIGCWKDSERRQGSKILWTLGIFITSVVGAGAYGIFVSKNTQLKTGAVVASICTVIYLATVFTLLLKG
jgi:hypothetical protein